MPFQLGESHFWVVGDRALNEAYAKATP